MRKIALVALVVLSAAGCSVLQSHSTHALPSADFLAVQELRDTTYFQNRSIGAFFSPAYYNARDSAYAGVTMDPVYTNSLQVDDLRAGDSLGVYSGSFFQAEKQILSSAYKILGAHQ